VLKVLQVLADERASDCAGVLACILVDVTYPDAVALPERYMGPHFSRRFEYARLPPPDDLLLFRPDQIRYLSNSMLPIKICGMQPG